MNNLCTIFGQTIEYNFLSSWIKYLRIKQDISQEALAYGICSTSHLCYFENGKRSLKEDIIEALLKKLGISKLDKNKNIGKIRQMFYSMIQEIEYLNFDSATNIYNELKEMEDFLNDSLYSFEFKIYKITYLFFVKKLTYHELKEDIEILDKTLTFDDNNLKYTYLLTSGRCIYKHHSHDEGIERLLQAQKLIDTPWINYHLGFSYCFNNKPLKGTYYLSKALESYEKSGKYLNAVLCHNTLSVCYSYLSMYDESLVHSEAALNGAKFFDMDDVISSVYIDLSDIFFNKKDYKKSIEYSILAMDLCDNSLPEFSLLAACNYIDAIVAIGDLDLLKPIFHKYLNDNFKSSRYYKLLYYKYLKCYHFQEDIFYEEIINNILPFYKKINYIELYTEIELSLIKHLESKRKYKKANLIYKDLLQNGMV